MKLNEGLIYTNENCIGCNRCISGCPVLGANISVRKNGKNQIHVDDEKCLHCGRCLETCHHNAREYRDDTKVFLEDLRGGQPISLVVAPSFFPASEAPQTECEDTGGGKSLSAGAALRGTAQKA